MDNNESNNISTEDSNNLVENISKPEMNKNEKNHIKKKQSNGKKKKQLNNLQNMKEKIVEHECESNRQLKKLLEENNKLRVENNEALLAKNTLENLCRTLNSTIKDTKKQCDLIVKQEANKRNELSSDLQSKLGEFTVLLNETQQKNLKLNEDNTKLQQQFLSIMEDVETRKQDFEKLQSLKSDLELTKKYILESRLEKEKSEEMFLKEKDEHLTNLTMYQKNMYELQLKEVNLCQQINKYSDVCKELNSTLTKNKKLIELQSEENKNMAKQCAVLEKNLKMWKLRYQESHNNNIDMKATLKNKEAEIEKLTKKHDILEKLIKTLKNNNANMSTPLERKKSATNGNQSVKIPSANKTPNQITNEPNIVNTSLNQTNVLSADIQDAEKNIITFECKPISSMELFSIAEMFANRKSAEVETSATVTNDTTEQENSCESVQIEEILQTASKREVSPECETVLYTDKFIETTSEIEPNVENNFESNENEKMLEVPTQTGTDEEDCLKISTFSESNHENLEEISVMCKNGKKKINRRKLKKK